MDPIAREKENKLLRDSIDKHYDLWNAIRDVIMKDGFIEKENKNEEINRLMFDFVFPSKRRESMIGRISTLLIYIGSPLVAIFVESIIGWLFYCIASLLGIIYSWQRKDKYVGLQFVNYLVWNVIAIITRLI